MRRLMYLLASMLLTAGPSHAVFVTTADLVDVTAGGSGTWTFSVGGWGGGGTVTGSFAGTDSNTDGRLSSFDGEVTDFGVSYSGGTIVAPFSLDFPNLFGLVYDLDGGPLGDGVTPDMEEGIFAGGPVVFAIGPGPVGVCGTEMPCGLIIGEAAQQVPEPSTGLLGLMALALLAGARRRPRSKR